MLDSYNYMINTVYNISYIINALYYIKPMDEDVRLWEDSVYINLNMKYLIGLIVKSGEL